MRSVIVANPGPFESVRDAYVVALYVRKKWTDPWVLRNDLHFKRCVQSSAGQDLSVLEFRHEYTLRNTWDQLTTFKVVKPIDLIDWWIKAVILLPAEVEEVIFIGRISDEPREPMGGAGLDDAGDPYRSGSQTMAAYGPLRELQRREIDETWWHVHITGEGEEEEFEERLLHGVQNVNMHDRENVFIGNRSAVRSDPDPVDPGEDRETYLFGGSGIWSHYEFVEYVLKRFMERTGGPKWFVRGDIATLRELKWQHRLRDGMNAEEMIRLAIPTELGLDFAVIPEIDEEDPTEILGFALHVFSLFTEETSFGEATLRGNTAEVEIENADEVGLAVSVERTRAHCYSRVRILGRPILVCCSLRGELAPVGPDTTAHSIVPKWPREILAEGEATLARGVKQTIGFALAEEDEPPRPPFVLVTPQGYDITVSNVTKTGFDAIWDPAATVLAGTTELDVQWVAGQLETGYLAGTGKSESTRDEHDEYRNRELFRSVFARYGTPEHWDHQNGAAAPILDAIGKIKKRPKPEELTAADKKWQNLVRKTEGVLPILESTDYTGTGDPASDVEDANKRDLLPPLVFTFELDDDFTETADDTGELTLEPDTPQSISFAASFTVAPLISFLEASTLHVHVSNITSEGFDVVWEPPEPGEGEDPLDPLTLHWVATDESKRTGKYINAEKSGLSVSPLNNDLGVLVRARPNHLLALRHFDDAADSVVNPKYDYRRMIATIAFYSDQRLMMETLAQTAEDDGSVKTLRKDDAELWYIAPGTVVDVDAEGKLRTAGGEAGTVVRDDRPRLEQVMAAATARYFRERFRAVVAVEGIRPWMALLGRALRIREQGGDLQRMQAAITQIVFEEATIDGESVAAGRTTIHTGFAEGRGEEAL